MLYEKIASLSQTIVECLNETDEKKVLKAFTELGIKILEADFGFVWLNSSASDKLEMVYASPGLPYKPQPPQGGGRNYRVLENCVPDFVPRVRKRADKYDVSRYMKSFVIIPICHRGQVYGNIVLCFKQAQDFSKEKRTLCTFMGNAVAQTITVHRLMASEHERSLFERERDMARFIADATHELRTPLAIIKGQVDLALQSGPAIASEARKSLRAIDHEVKHLSGMIGDMSLLTHPHGSRSSRFRISHVALRKLVAGAAERLSPLAAKKRIFIRVGRFPEIFVSGDAEYLDRLFANIVRNAILYGKEGGSVRIIAAKKGQMAHVDVRDDGIGISEEHMTHIFERFYRSAASRASNSGGTGLGLAIAKWVAEAHGGTVAVASSVNKGSTFTVSLPCIS